MQTPDSSTLGSSIYQRLLAQAGRSSPELLNQVLMTARQSMSTEARRVRGLLERDHLELCVKLMDSNTRRMGELFPAILLKVFERNVGRQAKPGERNSQRLHLEQLELMDPNQVQERVEWARMLQHVLLEVDTVLPDLNGYVCSLVGLDLVAPERNPLRPDAYVMALQQLLAEIRLPTQVRTTWLFCMALPLGKALNVAYADWCRLLAAQGVRRVGFSVIRTPETLAASQSPPERPGRVVWSPEFRQTFLTLDRLRRLMVGDLDATTDNPKTTFQRQFAKEFESGTPAVDVQNDTGTQTSFQATLPAALDALQEMQQVDVVVQRMQQRPAQSHGRTDAPPPGAAVRDELTRNATAMSQVLSLEVVSLMVENLVKDNRLLPAVRKVIERLETALLRLVIIDPRFFIDKAHPARRLLSEISQRGLAFGSENDPDFETFLLSLQRHVSPLAVLNIDGVLPFETALKQLLKEWDNPAGRASMNSQLQSAAAVLGYAEERNLLASQMTTSLMAMPEIRSVPAGVMDFLCGPWAQVMAEAQLKAPPDSDDPGGYKTLVNELLWSAQPDLTRKDIGRLTKLVPRLLSCLREGLGLIGYPSTKTSVFFDVLMKLHHQAFRPPAKEEIAIEEAGLDAGLLGNQDHWVAPAEAKASGFMVFRDEEAVDVPKVAPVKPEPPASAVPLKLGAWIELQVSGVWQRVQLSWISPHGTMFLFTSVRGKTQSMTQRFYERMLVEGKLRVLSDQASMVEDALDAVVHTAMLNSIDTDS